MNWNNEKRSGLALPKCICLWFVGLFLFCRLAAQNEEWPVLNEIVGIGYHEIDSSRTYIFYPYCKGTKFCTDLQLLEYGYVWDFGKERYSLDAIPRVQFEENEEVEITLRLTGFKTILDPDARKPKIRPAMSNCEVTDTLRGYLQVKAAKSKLATLPAGVSILKPSHVPVPGKCADYLLRIDLPKGCRFAGHLELQGGIASRAGGGGWEITGWEAAEELVVVQKGPGALDIDIPREKVSKHHPTKLYLLIHGKFDTSATLEDFFDLSVTGNLNALDAKAACTSKTVSETYLSKFAGSLDPPHLACGAPSQIKHGDRITWDIKVQNLGNAPESDIEIVDTLPPSLDWDRVEIQWALWNGKDIEVMVENDTANRILKWRLNNDAEPLLPGHYAQIQFITYVDLDYPCPDLPSGQTSPCQDRDWAGRPIVHRVWTKFHGEQVPGALNEIRHPLQNQETTVLCREACAPNVRPVNSEPGPSYITFWTIGGIIAALAAGLLIWRFYRIRGSR